MPEINSKRNTKKQLASHRTKKKPSTKKKGAITGTNLKWKSTSTTKSETAIPRKQLFLGLLGLFVFFLFILWAFVDDTPEWQRHAQQREQERRANETRAKQFERQQRSAALAQFNHAELMNSSSLSSSLQLMQTGEDDRLVVVAFADSTSGEVPGNVYRIKLFKKLEGIAKRIDKNKLFKRYSSEDLPRFVLFDCGSPIDAASENVCSQIVGQNIPNILIFRPSSQPRSLPSELKSDKDILSYLYRLMQPAVDYLEEVADAERFVSDDSSMHCVLFHGDIKTDAQKSAISVYDSVSDALRDYGRFGRSKNEEAMAVFDVDEAQLPALYVWRTFGANPILFSGNGSDSETVREFLLSQFVPLFGEFTPTTQPRFMQRALPILWFAVGDAMTAEARKALLEKGEELAVRYQGQLTFVYLDVDAQPQIAQNFGLEGSQSEDGGDEDEDMEDVDGASEGEGVPQVFIMNQIAQVKRGVDMDDVEGTVQGVIDEYLLQLRISRGQAMGELHSDDDPEFEDDDDFEDDDEEDEEYDTVIDLGAKGDEEAEKKDL